jgi:hypothetical protein
MKTLTSAIVGGLTGAVLVVPASASILSFSPLNSIINSGDSVSVDVQISGLTGAVALGAYQLAVSYDAVRVQVIGVSFPAAPASGLDLGTWGSVNGFDLSTPGVILFDQTSLETPGALAASQPDAFVLAQLTFKGLVPGSTVLEFSLIDLADAGGAALGPGLAFSGGINVVPEAGQWTLVAGLGLVGFAAWRRWRA